MLSKSIRTALAGLALAAFAAGCGGGGPAVTEAEGTVVGPDGKPMPNVLIQFNPVETKGAKVVSSSGVSGADGKFSLKADTGQPGAVAGKHKVVLIDNELNSEDEPTGKAGGKKAPTNRIPREYLSAATTPLEVVVEGGKKHELKVAPR